MSQIQKKIDEHITPKNDEKKLNQLPPRGTIVLNGGSGSFELPENIHLTLRGSSGAECTSNKGGNHLSFVNCTNPKVMDFKKGIIRFEKCSTIGQVKAEEATLNVGGATMQDVEMTDSEVNMLDCKPQSVKLEKSNTQSIKNNHQELEITGGHLFSSEDIVSGDFKVKEGAVVTSVDLVVNSDVTIEGSTFNALHGNFNSGDFSAKSSNIVLTDTKVESGDLEIEEDSVASLNAVEGKKAKFDKSLINFDDLDLKETEVTDSNFSGNKLKASDLTLDKSTVILVEPEVSGTLTISDSSVKLNKATITGSLSFSSGGALDSEDSEFKASATLSGGTITSYRDEFKGSCTGSSMKGPNLFYGTEFKGNATFTGDGKATLRLVDIDAKNVTINDFAHVEIIGGTLEKVTLNGVNYAASMNAELEELTATDVEIFLQAGGTISKATLSNINLSCTDSIEELTATNCFINDKGSTGTLSNCRGFTKDTTIESGANNLLSNVGGELTVTKSVVTTLGGTIANTGGGLTVGNDFDPAESSGSVCQEDDDLTIEAKGHINITSMGT